MRFFIDPKIKQAVKPLATIRINLSARDVCLWEPLITGVRETQMA